MKFGKSILFFIFCLLVVKSASASTLDELCDEIYKNNPPKFFITYNFGQLKYDGTKTSAELEKIYKTINSENNASHNINGLTYLEPNVTTTVRLNSQALDKAHYCFYPEEVNIKAWYNPTVYISNSLKSGSCRFNVTVRHEQTHLDLGHYALYLFAKSLRRNEGEIVSSVKPIVESITTFDGNRVVKEMTDAYHDRVKIYFEEFKKNLEKYNNIIDTSDNYRQETQLCLPNL